MSKLLKKSLALVLALALCLTAFVGCFSVSAEVASANYSIDFGTVTNGKVTATLKVASTKEDLAALLFTLDMPGVPVTAISTDSVFTVDTNPDYEDNLPLNGVKQLRVLVNSKTTNKSYNYANVYITFDVSSKALVSSGFDPDVSNKLDLVVTSMQAATYTGGYDGFEGNVWIIVNETATVNGGGQASASVSVKGTCTHNYVGAVHTAATCNNAGIKRYTCSYCGKYYDESITQLTHNWNDGVITTPAGCVKAGVKTFTCTLCGGTRTEPIDAVGSHNFFTGAYDGNSDHFDIREGTCGTDGHAYPKCTRCGEIDFSTSINLGTNENNHNVSSWTQTTAPTCGTAGVETGNCDDCFAEATRSIPATGNHSWNNGVVTAPGIKTFTCTVCGATKNEETDECSHATHEAAAYEANSNGTYDVVVRCADCNEVITSVATTISKNATVNSSVTITSLAEITSSIGLMYMTTNAQLTSYASYGIKVFRQATDANYDIVFKDCGELTEFTDYGKRMKYTTYRGIALSELNLPIVAVLCGYDANGALVAVSNPVCNNVTDLFWGLYTAETNEAKKTFYVDTMNMASEAQLYFGKAGSGLASVQLPRDKYAFDQSKATASLPAYDLATMPNGCTNNPSSTVSTSTYSMSQALSLGTGAPVITYLMKNANRKNYQLDKSKLVMEVSYTDGYGKLVSSTVTGEAATGSSDPWDTFGNYFTYTFAACKLSDTNKTVTAKVTYDGVEMYTSVYSVETFIAQNYTDATMGALLTSIGKFGVSARAYFGVN